ncbi:hypothetical protein B0H19DRAFT_1245870 [Mycena capillaripes]|nr:hypothetical protein B0H19DRAFT_1245870 [Mycena capillaripes]
MRWDAFLEAQPPGIRHRPHCTINVTPPIFPFTHDMSPSSFPSTLNPFLPSDNQWETHSICKALFAESSHHPPLPLAAKSVPASGPGPSLVLEKMEGRRGQELIVAGLHAEGTAAAYDSDEVLRRAYEVVKMESKRRGQRFSPGARYTEDLTPTSLWDMSGEVIVPRSRPTSPVSRSAAGVRRYRPRSECHISFVPVFFS